jgi:hypothetical protein
MGKALAEQNNINYDTVIDLFQDGKGHTKSVYFTAYLIEHLNLTETRATKLAPIVSNLHSSICAIDDWRSQKILNMSVRDLLNLYGKCEEMRNDL